MNNRDLSLDLSKGILIIIVVLGHSIQYSFGEEWLTSGKFFENIVFKIIYSFHMPLFMMISGYLFYNSNKKNFKQLVTSKLKVIGIPMLSFILLFNTYLYILLFVNGDILGICKHFITTIFCGMTMWFLFSLLLNITLIAVLTRLVKNKILQYSGMIILFVVSFFIPDYIVLSVHKFMFPFFCIGYVIKQHKVNIYACSFSKLRLSILTTLSVLAIYWFDKDTYIYTSGFCIIGNITNQLFIDCKRMIIAIVVSYTVIQYVQMFVSYDNRVTKNIMKLGQISLFLYGFNINFNASYTKALSLLSLNFDFNYAIPIIVTVCFILLSYYTYKLLEKSDFTRIAFLGK
jgi:fucose 4-O-acetylase-like acetyltransferase